MGTERCSEQAAWVPNEGPWVPNAMLHCIKAMQIAGRMGTERCFAAGNTGTKLWRQCAKTLQIAGSMGVAYLTFSIATSTQDALGIRLASRIPN